MVLVKVGKECKIIIKTIDKCNEALSMHLYTKKSDI